MNESEHILQKLLGFYFISYLILLFLQVCGPLYIAYMSSQRVSGIEREARVNQMFFSKTRQLIVVCSMQSSSHTFLCFSRIMQCCSTPALFSVTCSHLQKLQLTKAPNSKNEISHPQSSSLFLLWFCFYILLLSVSLTKTIVSL